MSKSSAKEFELTSISTSNRSSDNTFYFEDSPSQFIPPHIDPFADLNRLEKQLMSDDQINRLEQDARASRRLSLRMMGGEQLMHSTTDIKDNLPLLGPDKPVPSFIPNKNDYLVSFNTKEDPLHPHNWSTIKKIVCCSAIGLITFATSLGSAIFSTASLSIQAQYHIGSTVAALGTSLFVFGFASGPIVWGPLSELYGRKVVLVPSSIGFLIFCFATATSKDIQSIMICRFFTGFIGAAPLVVAPAAMADLFSSKTRGIAMTLFATVLFAGPVVAPITGAFIVKNDDLGWRWTQYITGMVGALSSIAIVFGYSETHHPIILTNKAEYLRRHTDNWAVRAPHEEIKLNVKEIVEKNFTRPLTMLITEPILLLITIYNAFIYGLLYLFLTAIPLIFAENYDFAPGIAELPYLGMLVGILIGGILCMVLEKRFLTIMVKNNMKPIPEERLVPMMIGSFFFAGGLFWIGWAGDFPNRLHWIVPTLGTIPIGFGLITVFLPCITYIVDCYLFFAASALAGNTFLRCGFGGAFPLFSEQLFTDIDIKWGATILGGVAVLLIPVPFMFYIWGKKIRQKSRFAYHVE